MQYTLTAAYHEEAVKTLGKIIAYPSVLDENAEGTPFGQDIYNCLKGTLEICEELGMRTFIDEEGYYGYAEVGEGEEMLVVLCHLDVVPVGDESAWKFPPFELTIDDDKLYGRGTQDDKGPSVAALYSLKALRDQGAELNKRVRFVFGTDEETLWRCMNRYNEKEEQGTYGFAPDSAFPLTYAEKGLLNVFLVGPGSKEFKSNNDGAFNVVPETASYSGEHIDELKAFFEKDGIKFTEKDGEITTIGKSVHSKDAFKGENALTDLVLALNEVYDHPALQFITKYLKENVHMTSLFGDLTDEMSGPLTVNFAKLIVTEEETKIALDIRIPVTADKDDLVKKLAAAAKEYGLEYQEFDYLASLYVPKDSELIKNLLAVYRELTGDMSEPMSSGGATFARTMKNCVAFGARLPEVPEVEHQVNENMPLSNFYDAMEIYAHAIRALAVNN
ncbi:M20 family metallopeptidase [Allofustis seminis]|uniref:M20 family metallopeptidase n=1 Tax=Allofustis seminis TaxID=166939 RepID=UPI0003651285|nr:M20 family metallopeptidase [Allofustis seminis]